MFTQGWLLIERNGKFLGIVAILFGINTAYASTPLVCLESYRSNYINNATTENELLKALQTDPNNLQCMTKLAAFYLKEGKASKGFRLIYQAYSLDPAYVKRKNISKVLDLALRLTRLEDLAKKSADKALYNELGNTYYDMGIFSDALEAFKKSLKIDPKQIQIKILTALSLGNVGKMKEAAKILKEVLDEQPYHFYANYYYGKILKNELERYEDGQSYLMAAEYIFKHLNPKFKTKNEREFIKRDLIHELQER